MFISNTVNGLPNGPVGYSPNTYPNNNQTILTNRLAINACLNIGTASIRPGYFLSKLSFIPGDTTIGLPNAAAVSAGNLWIATEGLVPDDLQVDSIQGDINQLPPAFTTGVNVNVIPFSSAIGATALLNITLAQGDTLAMNQPLYVLGDGTLTIDPTLAVNSSYSVGYILQSNQTTIANDGVYQMQVQLGLQYILQP